MELNNIHLTKQMIAELYPHVLVASTTTVVPEQAGIPFLGDNNKKIVVLVREPSVKFVPEKQLNFLVSVLTACQLSLADTAIVNMAGKHVHYRDLVSTLDAKVILMFGVSPGDIELPLDFPHFQVQAFTGQTYVCAPSLSEVEADLTMKKQLWSSLKKAFSI